MPIKSLIPADANDADVTVLDQPTEDVLAGYGVVRTADPNVLVFTKPQYTDLPSAVDALVGHMRQGETLLLAIARDVQAIRDLELYREAGVDTMEAFYPILLAETSRVGWGSTRTLKGYLAFTDTFLDCLALPGTEAMGALSHLQTLYVLADWDRKAKELRTDTEKDGKLGAVQFEAIVRVVTWMVNFGGDEGMDEQHAQAALGAAGLATEAQDFSAIAGINPVVPAGGWSVADTKALVERIRHKDEEPKAKVRKTWAASHDGDDYVVLHRLVLTREGEPFDSFDLNDKVLSVADFTDVSAGGDVRWMDADDE